jgi:pimeloyl-ACP methyl ester carboxylesterase
MAEISNFPYFEIQFTKEGNINSDAELNSAIEGIAQAGITDLLVFSHGWNNDMDEARQLYRDFFASARSVIDANKVPNVSQRKFGVLAILWPSKKFADKDLIASGAASLSGSVEDDAIKVQLDHLKDGLGTKEAAQKLSEAKVLLDDLENDPEKQDAYVEKIRSLLTEKRKDEEGSTEFFDRPGREILATLSTPTTLPAASEDEGGAATMGEGPAGGAANLGDFFTGIGAAALRVANYATYYLMKERAGIVGRDGVSKAVTAIMAKSPSLHVHLIGHSFGGRVVTAAANALGDDQKTRPSSMSLLQAAFSHNGFAREFDGTHDGFFREVVTAKKVNGPIIITHTHNDQAVGVAYPIASRLAGQDASALGDQNDRFGGLGRNGALFTPEAQPGQLSDVGQKYNFIAEKLFNLEATNFVKNHSDVTGQQVATAVLSAVSVT